jgi:RHS repeat-associated protein
MNLGYTGKPYDTAAGLYNYGYRDYHAVAARFTTVDPVRDGEVRVHQDVYDLTKGPDETWQHFRDEVLRNPGNINTDNFPD